LSPPTLHSFPTRRSSDLAGLMASLLIVATALAQDTNAPTKMKPTVVTGSLIPTAETVGPAPVETLQAADIERTGAQDALQLVRRSEEHTSELQSRGHLVC